MHRILWLLEKLAGVLQRAKPATKAILAITFILLVFTSAAMRWRPSDAVLAGVYIPLLFALLALVLRRVRFDYGTIAIILVGLSLYGMYLTYTTYTERNYDGPEELNYVTYIVQHHSVPPKSHCFVCHHPPVYYILAAFAYALFQRLKFIEVTVGLQLFSVLIFIFFIVFSTLLVRRFTSDVWRIRLATAIVVLWPYSFHNCCRVHNDTLVSTLMVVALYFIVAWHQDGRSRDLYLAAAMSGLAVLTKSSGYVVVSLLALLLVLRFVTGRDRLRHLRRTAIVAAILGGALFMNTLGKGAQKVRRTSSGELLDRRGALCQKILGTACDINPGAWVGNDPVNYVYFDTRSFLTEPYVITDRDDTGRQYFWNHAIKSSLFGTHNSVADRETSYELNAMAAQLINILTFGMMVYLALAATFLRKEQARKYGVVLAALGLLVAFAMAFRYLVPAPHHSDFRHIFPALPVGALLYATAVGHFGDRRSVLHWVGWALPVPLLLLSAFYFWPKYEWATRVTARVVQENQADWAQVVPEGTPWDKNTNLFIEGNHTVEFKVSPRQTVSGIDITLDNNDRYELKVISAKEERVVEVGPAPRPVKGLFRYQPNVEPPVENVTKVQLRPVQGDRAYSMGHIALR